VAVSDPSVPTRIDANILADSSSRRQASFVIAITMPATTNTMIAICVQSQWRGTAGTLAAHSRNQLM
jgi:hypothetical protein